MENKENMIEWLVGQHNIRVTLTDPKYIRKVKKLDVNIRLLTAFSCSSYLCLS